MNLKKIENLYSNNIRALGVSSEAVGWNSKESQYLRFEKLLSMIDLKEEFSINELGCGYGELYKYLINKKYHFSLFNGYDISEEMLKECEVYLNQPSNLNLYHSSNIETLSDYTIALIYLLIIIQRNGKSILIRLYKTCISFRKRQ